MIRSLKSGLFAAVKAVLAVLFLLVLLFILARIPPRTDVPVPVIHHATTHQEV